MRIEQLRYFVEVAKCHSIAIAAEKIFVTQPTISIAMKNLEKELGCVLFDRSKNGVNLTEIGRKVLKKGEKILQEENDIYMLVEKDKLSNEKKLQGSLKIASVPMIMHSFLPNVIFDFLNINDGVKIAMKAADVAYIVNVVLNNDVDIGFSLLADEEIGKLQENEEMYSKKLFSEKTYVVAHKKFELSGNISVRSDELGNLPIVSFSSLPITYYNNLHDKKNEDSKVILQTYSLELIKRFIFSGKAISILSSSVVSKLENIDEIDIIPISDWDSGKVYYFYRKDNKNREVLTVFEAEMLRHC